MEENKNFREDTTSSIEPYLQDPKILLIIIVVLFVMLLPTKIILVVLFAFMGYAYYRYSKDLPLIPT